MQTYKKNYFKFVLGFIICFLIRLIPFRPPNIEPILATQMPFSKVYGAFSGFSFAFLSILLFDIFTKHFGIWSFLTAFTYGILGFIAYFYFKRNLNNNISNYVIFAIFGTLFFDIITGLSIGPLFFNQSFLEAFLGQIPFTLWHLLGNISFAIFLSPIIYRYIIYNEKFEDIFIWNYFFKKI